MWIITTVSIVFANILVGFGTWLKSIVSMVKTFAVYLNGGLNAANDCLNVSLNAGFDASLMLVSMPA